MLSAIERSRSAYRAEFNERIRHIIDSSWSDDVKTRMFNMLLRPDGKFHSSKFKWQKLKEKYPEESAEIMKEYNKKYSNAPISITMDNYHDDEYLLEEIRKLEGPQGEIVMLKRDAEKLVRKIDGSNEALRKIGYRINELEKN